jgi:GNAT superfamily N-acetyltransferase
MSKAAEQAGSAELAVIRVSEDGWRAWREIRLAALAEAPDSFADTLAGAAALPEHDWRAMTRAGAIFVATAGPERVGVAAGVPRESPAERGLGAMWVAPPWRGSSAAPMLAGAVIAWARSEGAARLRLWVPADHPRARAFYERQGFRATGLSRPFPDSGSGSAGRSISEMSLDLGGWERQRC